MRKIGGPAFGVAAMGAFMVATLPISTTRAQDAYVIGLTGALTGPASSTQAPVIEGLRIYVDRLNAKGGINGHPIKLVVQDDAAEPSKAAANATKLLTQDKVLMLINSSLSSTYPPVMAETKRAKVPLWFAGAICPKETHPPADEFQYCSTGFDLLFDGPFAIDFLKATAQPPVKLGLAGMAIPIARMATESAGELAKQAGMTVVDMEIIPPPTPDYTPFATKLMGAGADWVFSWSPWVTQIKTFEALRRLGWTGSYLAYAHIEAEGELARLNDGKFMVFGSNAFFQDDLPVHQEIRAAAEQAKSSRPVNQLTEGWLSGLVLEAALTKTPWPPTPDKLRAALDNLTVDTKGLRGGPIVWTKENHFRTRQYYRVYGWDSGKKSVTLVKDWTGFDVNK
jgi:ABC-type branched-subunit amino acid transport system substrate-binding protein